ncbi:MAG: DNA polymerase III subunit alpha [Armatimonadetes bacterium]|nr:DNA polymerase III subunit alpha [Armatimonadota bacterium]
MSRPFVHLHNHTEYSLLDGANRIPDMVARAKELDMPAVAITDHGVMFGCMEFYFECKKKGVKPLIGMEAYVAPNGLHNKQGREENQTYHLLLLAKNNEGYKNLCKLHSIAALQGFYYKPRIDHEVLAAHAKGIISSTTCLGSEVNRYLAAGDYDKALRTAAMYKEIFDEGSYFVELQNHGIPEQLLCNEGLVKIAKELHLPLVATNDAHYLCKGDAEPHDVLLCIGTGDLKDDPKRLRFSGPDFYMKTVDEMAALFPDHPEAIENSLMFADMCDVELGSARALMPTPVLEEGHDPSSYLTKLAEKGLIERCPGATDESWQRLNYELEVIGKTGYESYFLLVREFAQFTRDQGIMFGVRGSAAGSLVSYALGITDVNPVEYDLTFERFLNPERVSMPDIDMDFEDARRDEVIRWVSDRYGQDRVAQIVTFGTLGAKASLRDAARVMGFLPAEADKIAKTIPTGPGWSIARAEKEIPEFRGVVESDSRYQPLVDTAKRIEGLARHAGVHAAGVVISQEPLDNYIPLYRSNEGQAVTAYDMGILEKIGLLKMDFLGLSNLTVLARTIENIRATHADVPDDKLLAEHPVLRGGHQAIPFDDQATYDMLGRGDTVGVFQLESGGMRRNIIELKPQNVRELAAMVALYRPGPMEMIPSFINNKFGRTKPQILDEKMRPILDETFGIIVYQDQVLKLVQALAGFSLGKADILRRAMGKKDLAIMESMQGEFVDGCLQNGVTEEVAGKVWELLLPFAGYAFNKAHAVCYAILAYQTAYLKAKYPVEYMAALLAAYRTKEERITTFIEECRRQGIPVLPPDVNLSHKDFVIEKAGKKQAVRFGLGAIKGVGDGLVEMIIAERTEAPFTHLYEFCERLRPHGLNKVALDALIRSGALSGLHKNRMSMMHVMEGALVFADEAVKRKNSPTASLFAGSDEVPEASYPNLPTEVPNPTRSELLKMEKETMGIYVSDHPLRGYERTLASEATHTAAQLQETEESLQATIAGVLASCAKTTSQRTGARMCRMTIEDFTGQMPCFLYGEAVTKYDALLVKDQVVALRGRLKFDERPGMTEKRAELQVFEVKEIAAPVDIDSLDESVAGSILLKVFRATKTQLGALREVVEANPGEYEVVVQFPEARKAQPIVLIHRVAATDNVLRQLRLSVERCEVDVVHRRPSGLESDQEGKQETPASR